MKAALKKGTITEDSYIWIKNPGSLDDIPTFAGAAVETKAGELPKEILHSFSSDGEARLAYDEGAVDLHTPIMDSRYATINGE